MAVERRDFKYFPPKVVKSDTGESQPALSLKSDLSKSLSPQQVVRRGGRSKLPDEERIRRHQERKLQATQGERKSGGSHTPETRAKMSEAHTGKQMSPETRGKMSEAKRGKPASEAQLAHIRHLAELKKGKKLKPHSPETRAKMSEAHTGKQMSPETRAKISEALRDKPLTPEHRARVSEALKGKTRKPLSAETKAKISEAQRRRFERKKQQAKLPTQVFPSPEK